MHQTVCNRIRLKTGANTEIRNGNIQHPTCSVEKIPTFVLPLPSEGVGQNLQSSFGQHLIWPPGTDARTDGAFQAAKEALYTPSPVIALLLYIFRRHLRSPFSSRRAVSPPRSGRNQAFHSPLLPTMRVNPFRVITRI